MIRNAKRGVELVGHHWHVGQKDCAQVNQLALALRMRQAFALRRTQNRITEGMRYSARHRGVFLGYESRVLRDDLHVFSFFMKGDGRLATGVVRVKPAFT